MNNRNIIISSNKRSLFDIDLRNLQTYDSDSDNTFEDDINPLYDQFKDSIDNNDYDELIDCLETLKDNVIKYKYTILTPYIDDWESLLSRYQDGKNFTIVFEDIEAILNHMAELMREKKEANLIQTHEFLDSSSNSMERDINDNNNKDKDDKERSDNNNTPKHEESILQELKPFSISCFFKSNLDIKDFEEHLKLFTTEEKKEKIDFLKNLPKPLKNMNPFIDCNYPFKEEKFSCILI